MNTSPASRRQPCTIWLVTRFHCERYKKKPMSSSKRGSVLVFIRKITVLGYGVIWVRSKASTRNVVTKKYSYADDNPFTADANQIQLTIDSHSIYTKYEWSHFELCFHSLLSSAVSETSRFKAQRAFIPHLVCENFTVHRGSNLRKLSPETQNKSRYLPASARNWCQRQRPARRAILQSTQPRLRSAANERLKT